MSQHFFFQDSSLVDYQYSSLATWQDIRGSDFILSPPPPLPFPLPSFFFPLLDHLVVCPTLVLGLSASLGRRAPLETHFCDHGLAKRSWTAVTPRQTTTSP